jgi:pimeloyl-ACP methyl ester carboxylesterase
MAPKQPRQNAPLVVVLHSANRTAYDYLGYACLNRATEGSGDPATAVTNPPDDFYALFLNSTNAEWWGWGQAHANKAKGVNAPTPAERRVLDTVEWVAARYRIDRNRVYLCGVSMGGCGALGIGLPHGDVFAAVRVTVPAGTGYANYRMGGFAPSPAADAPQAARTAFIQRAAAVGLPDPPVVVDLSSPIDVWATTQPALVQAAQVGRLPLVLGWGPFGHPSSRTPIEKYTPCEAVLAYPWLEVRKNEAYPVFTCASCDQRSPWLNAPAEYDESGQMNAYFRWRNQKDAPTGLVMQLWIAQPTLKNPPPALPKTATADVTLRRLQQFKPQPGRTYSWQVTRDGRVIASGKTTPDATNLLTIHGLEFSETPTELSITTGVE